MNSVTFDSGAKLTPFLAPNPNGTGVLVLPGGGYGHLAVGHEGQEIGEWLNERGFDAWMLEYRIAQPPSSAPLHPAPINDAKTAVDWIRSQNRVQKLGIWGFSAGGHLAATTLTESNIALDFGILAYPVISLEHASVHQGSRRNLLGEVQEANLIKSLSAENRVSAQTPPAFIFHTTDDPVVAVENALMFAAALRENNVSFELHIHESGPHGLAKSNPDLANWSEPLHKWLLRR
jgi:acetyl esterase/lipase